MSKRGSPRIRAQGEPRDGAISSPSPAGSLPDPNAKTWAKKLFSRSVLKQLKWKALEKAAGDPAHKRCLDLGSDNGVVSLLFREKGGEWRSADLDPGAVESVRALGSAPTSKGAVLTHGEAAKLKKKVAVYAAIYPFLKAFSALDRLAPAAKGSLLVATASRRRNAAA